MEYPARSFALTSRTPNKGNIKNGFIMLGSASEALYTCTIQAMLIFNPFAAASKYGASTIHFPPSEGRNNPRMAEYIPAINGD